MKLKIATLTLFSGALACFPSMVSAASPDGNIYTVGMGYYQSSKYSGSNESTYEAIPYFRVQHGNYFLDTLKGVGFSAEMNDGFYFTQAFGYATGRTDYDANWKAGSKKLRGMGKIRAVINSSTTIGWHVSRDFAIEASLYAPLTDSQGLSYEAGFNYKVFEGAADTLVLSSGADFGDARNNNLFYGVSETQSRRSGYERYQVGSGLYSVNAGLNWTHIFNENWWSFTGVTYTHLTHNVSHSPIVFRKDETALSLGLLYSF